VRIETNYRSTPEILSLANESIAHNTRQFPKKLKAVKESSDKPARVSVHESRQQAKFVAQRVLELHDGGQDLADIAVLYRSHFHSMELQMELTKRNIPFRITSGLPFFQQAHVKDVSAFLRFAVNEEDEISFKRVALMLPGVGGSTAHRMWHGVHSREPWDQIKVPGKCRAVWDQWGETHAQLKAQLENTSPDQLIQQVMDAVYEEFLKVKFTNYLSRMDDLRQLQAFAEGFPNMEEFLGQLSLMSNLDSKGGVAPEEEEDKLILSSIHQAKGLEWKSVFVLMLCDGMFPSSRSMESEEGEEEERRLFYVAVTRAQDELYLVHPQVNSTRGGYGDVWQQPSRFLEEISGKFYETWKISEESAWDDF
ncbi:MAG: ATP-dependent helicase, partial [Verrucomicrobiota bacterium]